MNKDKMISILRFVFMVLPVAGLLLLYAIQAGEIKPEAEETAWSEQSVSEEEAGADDFEEFDDFGEEETGSDAVDDKKESCKTKQEEGDDSDCSGCPYSISNEEFSDDEEGFATEEISSGSTFSESDSSGNDSGFQWYPERKDIFIILISYIGVIASGYLIRFSKTRKLRIFFVLGGLAFFGFYVGGCPCPIMSFFKIFMVFRGDPAAIAGAIWFLGLAYLTYFMGKGWCGWLCPLGAVQEFLYKKGVYKPRNIKRMNRILSASRIMLTLFFIGYLLVTGVMLFAKADPFKPIFNLFYGSISPFLWTLIAVTLIGSILISRPFCRGVCPIGLVLGLVSKIPGSVKIEADKECTFCARCEKNCFMNAIDVNRDGVTAINYDNCVFCGDCLDNCASNSMKIVNK